MEKIKEWIILVIITLIFGGIVAYFGVKKGNTDMKKKNSEQSIVVRE